MEDSKFRIKITYSWSEEYWPFDEPLPSFDYAWQLMCESAAHEACEESRIYPESTCDVFYDWSNGCIILNYHRDNTVAIYEIVEE